jgi:hypothetical protein
MKGFEVLASVVMKVSIFWDIAPCSPYMKRRFGGCISSLQGRKRAEEKTSVQQVARQNLIFDPENGGDTSSETSVYIPTTLLSILDEGNIQGP